MTKLIYSAVYRSIVNTKNVKYSPKAAFDVSKKSDIPIAVFVAGKRKESLKCVIKI